MELKTNVIAKGGFDMAAHRKSRQAKTAKVDLIAGLNEISPEIAALKVGETVQLSGVEKGNIRKVVMSLTTKLSHLTAKGGEWEGKSYDVASDSDAGIVYVQRGRNLKPEEVKVRRKGGGGGRRKKADAPAQTEATPADTVAKGEDAKVENGTVIKEHA